MGERPRPSLALVTIARDEERCIARLLRSARDVVDEMVVVDTGSADATQEIARAEGARVSEFAWVDDFAAARNEALGRAKSDYCLVLDADEWITAGGAGLREWMMGLTGPSFGEVTCVSTFDAGEQCAQEQSVRVLPVGARYRGRIHEQPVGPFPLSMTPLRIAHDGYDEAQMDRKRGRNERLLRDELGHRPDDGYLWYQLGCSLDIDERYTEACEAFERALPLIGGDSPQRHPLVIRYLHSLGGARRLDEVVAFYQAEVGTWGDSPDLHFVMSDVLLDLAVSQPHRVTELLPLIRALLERCLQIGERPDLPGAVVGRGSTSARHNLDLALGQFPTR